ncbi:Crp/Fnr family transcriptional regulator [Kitasatospora sp. CM 4170]|uniref:Crp/Fnr family transcriptional regulator n=1 Tax=Kitasatospora aburaviensis TaxID=67265 RepID=A0ABW1F0N6_9ACTN|nr:Crp/Fnr family transcriptional regulator [Kitasatospora sp. CM 4170]WNM47354.1 Crp/Fnr family transcriptional regulator [Kitasatospora sp. CM 4170]
MSDASALSKAALLERLVAAEDMGSAIRFRAGQTIIQEGDLSNHVVMLRTGSAKVVTRNADDVEIILGLRAAPEIIGEQAALNGTPRSASVIALTDVTALAVSAEDFRTLVAKHPEAAAAVLGIVTERLREADQGRLELATHTVAQRVAERLVALVPQIGVVDEAAGVVRLPLSQQDLAGWAGASREAVVRTLRLLRDEGVVTTERRQIVIHDLESLRSKAGD